MILIKPSHKILTTIDSMDILERIEQAGRTCYKSENRITSDSSKKFVSQIIKRGHHSVIEHVNISVYFICDRGVTHELVRHRLCAFSQESTRYCNYKGGVTFVIPLWIELQPGEYQSPQPNEKWFENKGTITWFSAMYLAEKEYLDLLDLGWTPQQARSVLPNSLKTEIMVTANIREWRHILTLRTSSAAHPQIREVMIPLLREFQARIPILFDDILEETK